MLARSFAVASAFALAFVVASSGSFGAGTPAASAAEGEELPTGTEHVSDPLALTAETVHRLNSGPRQRCGRRYFRTFSSRGDDIASLRATVLSPTGRQGLGVALADEYVVILRDTSDGYQEFWFLAASRNGRRVVGFNVYGAGGGSVRDRAVPRILGRLDHEKIAADLRAGRPMGYLRRALRGQCGHFVNFRASGDRQAAFLEAAGLTSGGAVRGEGKVASGRIDPVTTRVAFGLAGQGFLDALDRLEVSDPGEPDIEGFLDLPVGTSVLAQLDLARDALGCRSGQAVPDAAVLDITSILGVATSEETLVRVAIPVGLDTLAADSLIRLDLFGSGGTPGMLRVEGSLGGETLEAVARDADGEVRDTFELPFEVLPSAVLLEIPALDTPLAMVQVDVLTPVGDGTALCDEAVAFTVPSPLATVEPAAAEALFDCLDSATSLCVGDRIEVSADAGAGSDARLEIARLSDEPLGTSIDWPETTAQVRVHDACDLDGRYWTEVTFVSDPAIDALPPTHRITVTDVQTSQERTFVYPFADLPPEVRGSDLPPTGPQDGPEALVPARATDRGTIGGLALPLSSCSAGDEGAPSDS